MGILLAGAANAGDLSLDDCIQLALQNRASIIAAHGSEQIAKANQMAALGAFLPSVSAGYSYSKSKQRDIKSGEVGAPLSDRPDQNGSNKNTSISAGMTLINFADWFDYYAARASRAQAGLDVLGSELDLIYSVKVAYYAYLAAAQNVDVQTQAVARSEEQLKLINSKYDLGSASVSDVLKQKVLYGNDKLALLRANNAVVTSKASLAYTIGVDPNADYEFSSSYETKEYDGSLEDAITYGLQNQPTVLAAEKGVVSSRHSLHARKASYLPYITGSGSYSKSSGTSGDTLLFDFQSKTLNYGFRVNWNIFDGFLRERSLTSAKVGLNNARAVAADQRNFVKQNIKTAFYDIQQQSEAQKVAGENVDAAQEDLKITQEKYNLGSATILDLLDAQVSLKQAQVNKIQTDFDLNLAIAQLDNAMGKR
jgi:outer membrane protein